jgi:kynurenine formamidase
MGGAWTLETLPAARLVAPLSVIQVQRKNFAGSEQLLTMDDVAEYERLHGPIPQGSVVLAFSAKKDVVPVFDAISLEFLIEARNVIGVGNAGTSVSPPQANSLLATKGVYELLNVANVSELPQTNSVIIAAPQKTPGAAEGPVRLMALLK